MQSDKQVCESIVKKILINKIALPNEILDHVKSFIFYDNVTSHSRMHKSLLCKVILEAQSKNNSIWPGDTHWGFSYYEHPCEDLQLQAVNCPSCGNYKISNNEQLNGFIMCNC